MTTYKVLFIDDDKMVQKIAQLSLTGRGLTIFSALTTAEADVILKKENVDIIVCDVLMEGEDGLSYCKRLRDEGNFTPVIFLSALADPVTVNIGITSGAAVYMVKPFDTQELHERILKIVNNRPSVAGAA